MLVLQSCTDSLHILPGSSGESHATPSDGVCNFSNIEFEEDIDLKEESFIAINEEGDTGIKQEDIPEDRNFPDMMAEPDEVSYVCLFVYVCLLLDTIYQCTAISLVYCDINISGHLKTATLLGMKISLIWHPQNWRDASLLSIPFIIKQYLY